MQYILKSWPQIIELASVYKRLREFETKLKLSEETTTIETEQFMDLSKKFLDEIINVTSNAAIACHPHLGKQDKI